MTKLINNRNDLFEILGSAEDDNGYSHTYTLEGFCFTYDTSINFMFSDVSEFLDVIDENNLEVEFWKLNDVYDVDNIETLKELCDLLETENAEDIEQWLEVVNDGYANDLAEAKRWADDNYFCEYMNNTDLGYYVIDNGLFGVEIPEALECYIDHEAIGRDWSFDLVQIGNNYYFSR